MTLAIDIGNSNVVIGVYYDGLLAHNWRIVTDRGLSTQWYEERIIQLLIDANVDLSHVTTVVLSSVIPEMIEPFSRFLNNFFRSHTIVVGPDIYSLLELEILRPDEIGPDLVANAYSARKKYRRDVLVIDFGTALTCTAVGFDWRIHGVSIAPGIGTAVRSLRDNTAMLPEVNLEMPGSVLGKNTVEAIQSGVIIGYVGLVEKLVAEYMREWSQNAFVVATGGLLRVLHPLRSTCDEFYSNLTLDGLYAIGQRVTSLTQ